MTNSIGQNLTARWILFALAAITFLVPPTLAWLSAAIDPSSGLGVVLKGINGVALELGGIVASGAALVDSSPGT